MTFQFNEKAAETWEPLPTQQERIGLCFEKLRGEILTVLESDASYRDTIQRLESELSVYKRAYADIDSERKHIESLKAESDKKREILENQLKGNRVVALLDGDGAIFSSNFISQGQAGGHLAAQELSDSILQHLSSNYGTHHYQLWVYVFFNKRGLMDTFGRVGIGHLKPKFEDFIMGFNQASERFIMMDVGNGKEAADAKIKALLEDNVRLPQTERIIFGGCHDNGYVTTLRSQITAGFKDKLILLRSYAEIAASIVDLELPILTIPDLFMTYKLGMPVTSQTDGAIPKAAAAVDTVSLPGQFNLQRHVSVPEESDQGLAVLPFATSELDVVSYGNTAAPSSYAAVLQLPKRSLTPDLEPAGSCSSSDDSEEIGNLNLPSSKPRHLKPNVKSPRRVHFFIWRTVNTARLANMLTIIFSSQNIMLRYAVMQKDLPVLQPIKEIFAFTVKIAATDTSALSRINVISLNKGDANLLEQTCTRNPESKTAIQNCKDRWDIRKLLTLVAESRCTWDNDTR